MAIIEAKYDEAYKQTEAYYIERDSFIFESELKLERDIQNLKRESLKKQIEDYIDYYNNKRIKTKLSGLIFNYINSNFWGSLQ